jgi:hypothetical protein
MNIYNESFFKYMFALQRVDKNLQFALLQLGPLLALNIRLITKSFERKTSTRLKIYPKNRSTTHVTLDSVQYFPIISSNRARS